MLDRKFIRENPEIVRDALRKRGMAGTLPPLPPAAGVMRGQPAEYAATDTPLVDALLAADEERRKILTELETWRNKRNVASREIGRIKDDETLRESLKAEARKINEHIGALEKQLDDVNARLEKLDYEFPNIPDPSVPIGKDETENVVVRQWGRPRQFDFDPLPHWDLGPALGILDFERGVKLAGSRFYVLSGAGAKLQRALIQWMLDLHANEHGYGEVYPPFVVKEECMWGAGQLPKFRDNLYHDVEDDVWLVPTAEVPVTNLHRDEILDADRLPLRYVAYTPCFRREKMSAGRDVRGIKRGHQFDKVEMYTFCAPETSGEELERMTAHAEATCAELGLAYRLKQLCTGDLGFAARKTYDVEAWAPGSGEWLEVSSISNCGDFQARRANVRFRRAAGARLEHPHTLNGSGLGLPRTLIAVLETYQQSDGSVVVPPVLLPWMGGVEVVRPEA